MGICQNPFYYKPTKGNRKWCSECNKKITEGRVARIICKFDDEILMKIKNLEIRNKFRKKLWQTFKPLFSTRLKIEIKKKRWF